MSTPANRTGAETKAEGPRPAPAPEARPDRPSQRPGGAASLVGQVLSGRYLIERLIGEGGMGAVYQAEHTHMRKRLAVKVLHPEMSRMSEVVARFEREAMAAAHIEHPNVAAATDFGKLEDGSFFLVLEYVEGKSLREAQAVGPLELGRALHITRQIASALARAHTLGIVHRDLKPENVMLVSREGDPDFVKVLDFGIAKVPVGSLGSDTSAPPGQALTQLGMVYGTPEYMAPEQALGQEVDPRADVYALGIMAFEMITGNRPFEHGSKVTLLGMHVTAPIPSMRERAPGANVPPEVEAIVTRQLAKEASARFADAKELIEALDAAMNQLIAQGRIAEVLPPASALNPRASFADMSPANRSGSRAALALGPTGLAQPSVRQPAVPPVTGSPTRAFSRGPAWLTPRLAVGSGVAVALALVVSAVLAVRGGEGPATVPGSSASTAAGPPPPPPDPAVESVIADAQTKIERGDFASGIDELVVLEKKGPDRADVHALLERAYTGARNVTNAMREAGLWLAAAPEAAADAKLQEDVRNGALLPIGQDDAFALLEAHMGTRGIDILYDIAYGTSGRQYPQAATRARKVLDAPDVRGRASPALSVLFAFRDGRTCEIKHGMLDEVRAKGDSRMVSILTPYESARGCGFLNRSDCYPCMHRDRALHDTIQALSQSP